MSLYLCNYETCRHPILIRCEYAEALRVKFGETRKRPNKTTHWRSICMACARSYLIAHRQIGAKKAAVIAPHNKGAGNRKTTGRMRAKRIERRTMNIMRQTPRSGWFSVVFAYIRPFAQKVANSRAAGTFNSLSRYCFTLAYAHKKAVQTFV